ncbi:MAG: hypothetical protein LBD06_06325 [Candidatus Accumulibacter sp.]|nr:hypothetical protein [Accumulibacter sp.]
MRGQKTGQIGRFAPGDERKTGHLVFLSSLTFAFRNLSPEKTKDEKPGTWFFVPIRREAPNLTCLLSSVFCLLKPVF